MSESLLQMRDVRSGYEDMEILKGVSMDIFPSGITCMIGPNGAGKSTVLRTVYGILRLRGGQISFEGERIDGKKP
ncbi:MAG TPA: ATP-binding cassette domain-containing protein, partial [Desulfatiglandales bacterium]|nr:ATP-binding cassette domain-containing protein [Desulfatiglandales bacterium]